MQKEIRIFFTALMFYTRIPCPSWVDHDPDYIDQCTRYFPLIGWIVGGISGGLLIGAMQVLPVTVAVILSMVASVWITGAFHEDGFADVCDGFGGGWTREQILEIMKDSRVGAYALIGTSLLLLLKFATLTAIGNALYTEWLLLLFVVIAAHSVSRFWASRFILTHEYVREDAGSKVKPVAKGMGAGSAVLALLFGVLPLVVFLMEGEILPVLAAFAGAGLIKWWLGRFYVRWIGGYTGDCLGATQQLTEITFLLILCGFYF